MAVAAEPSGRSTKVRIKSIIQSSSNVVRSRESFLPFKTTQLALQLVVVVSVLIRLFYYAVSIYN